MVVIPAATFSFSGRGTDTVWPSHRCAISTSILDLGARPFTTGVQCLFLMFVNQFRIWLCDSPVSLDIFSLASLEGYGFTFTIGAGKVIAGWEHAILTMKVGERAKLFIDAKYGYGEEGSPGDVEIPPNANLVFEVELKSFTCAAGSGKDAEIERLKLIRAEREAAAAKRKADAEAKKLAAKEAMAARAASKQAKGKKGKKKKGKGKKTAEAS